MSALKVAKLSHPTEPKDDIKKAMQAADHAVKLIEGVMSSCPGVGRELATGKTYIQTGKLWIKEAYDAQYKPKEAAPKAAVEESKEAEEEPKASAME